jgi:hypothetical protein
LLPVLLPLSETGGIAGESLRRQRDSNRPEALRRKPWHDADLHRKLRRFGRFGPLGPFRADPSPALADHPFPGRRGNHTLPLASRYPTIGPSGVVVMDVNELAGSIELYFGRDVLEQGPQLVPVQWKGFDEGLRRYQGEITDKAAVQRRFDDKLAEAEACRASIEHQDWTGMTLILDQLRRAFHAQDAAEILDLGQALNDNSGW